MGYLYRIWTLYDDNSEVQKKICIRCSVHSHVANEKKINEDGEEEAAYMNIYALNEFNPNLTDWKSSLD